MKIAITGGSGFVGRAITRLLMHEHDVVWLSHKNLQIPKEFQGITITHTDYSSEKSIATAFKNCDVVIHLVGILHENSKNTFEDIHHQLPQRIIKAAAQADVSYYLHMAALGISNDSQSQYLITKYNGEKAAFALAKDHDISVVSFRPSVIFGPEDNFLNQFTRLLKYAPFFPVVCPQAKFQPVHVDDVAKAFAWGVTQLNNGSTISGKTYDLVGADVYTMHEIIQMICNAHSWKKMLIPVPDTITKMQGKMMAYLPNPPFTYDNYLSMQTPNTSQKWDWQEMGMEPKRLIIEST